MHLGRRLARRLLDLSKDYGSWLAGNMVQDEEMRVHRRAVNLISAGDIGITGIGRAIARIALENIDRTLAHAAYGIHLDHFVEHRLLRGIVILALIVEIISDEVPCIGRGQDSAKIRLQLGDVAKGWIRFLGKLGELEKRIGQAIVDRLLNSRHIDSPHVAIPAIGRIDCPVVGVEAEHTAEKFRLKCAALTA